jgi:hypothetical protein
VNTAATINAATSNADPDLKIPEAVRAAAARADELHRTLRDQPVTSEGNPVTSEGNPELSAESLAKDAPRETPKEVAKDTSKEATKSEAPKKDGEPEGEDSWEHKYKSVYGRYIRAQEQVRTMSEQIKSLQGVIATMQAAAAAPVQAGDIPELKAERLVTDEEINDYGEDFLKVVGKRAREEMAPIIGGYKAEIERLKKQLEGVSGFVQQDSQQKLFSRLDEKLPNWREVNTNTEFLNWLTLPDPYSGAIRHDMLKAAYAQGDAHRVLAFFTGFLAEEAAVAPAGNGPDTAPTTRVAKVPLESFAAPGRAKTAAAPQAPAEKPIITRAQVAAFYADVAAGKYRGKDDAKNQAEATIFAAQRDGRIR